MSRTATPTPKAKPKKKNEQGQKSSNALVKKAGTTAIAKHPKPEANDPFQLIMDGTFYHGIDEVMNYARQATPEQRVAIFAQVNKNANRTFEGVEKKSLVWYDFIKAQLQMDGRWNEEEFKEDNPTLYSHIDLAIKNRDKKSMGLDRIKKAWEGDKRGQAFIDNYILNPDYTLLSDRCSGQLGTLAQTFSAIDTTKLLNEAILKRARTVNNPDVPKRGKGGFCIGITSGDVNVAFSRKKEAEFKIENVEIPDDLELTRLRLQVGVYGLLEKEGNPELKPAYFPPDETEAPRFSNPRIQEVKDNDQANVSVSPAHGVVHGNNDPKALKKARAGKKKENPIVIDEDEVELGPEVIEFLNAVQETQKNRVKKFRDVAQVNIDGLEYRDEASGLNARRAAKRTILEYQESGENISVIARNSARSLREPGSSKEFVLNSNPLSLNLEECKCEIPDHIKRRLEHGDINGISVSLLAKLNIYKHHLNVTNKEGCVDKPMCDFHLRLYASYLDMKTGRGIKTKVLKYRLDKCYEHRGNFATFRLKAETDKWFKVSTQVEHARHETDMGPSKYLAEHSVETEAKILNPSSICNEKFKQMADTVHRDGITNLETFSFIMARAPRKEKGTPKGKKSDLHSFDALLEQEFKMYQYHCRTKTEDTNGLMLRNMMYSVIQQLVRMDHGIYLMTVAARRDGVTHLVSYPDFARYFPLNDLFYEVAFTQADMPEAVKSREPIIEDRVMDFVFLSHMAKKKKGSDNDKDVFHAVKTMRGGHKCTKALERVKKNTRLHSLDDPGSLKRWEGKYDKKCGGWKPLDLKGGSVIMAMQGTPIWINTHGVHSFRMVSANLTAVSEDGDTLENGVKWLDLHKAVLRLEAPPVPRWEDPADVPITSAPFAARQTVTGMGPLSEALAGRLHWCDPAVIAERDYLFSLSPKDLKKHLDERKEKTKEMALKYWESVKQAEMVAYGDKSYFRYLERGQNASVPDADPEFQKEKLATIYQDGNYTNLQVQNRKQVELQLSKPYVTESDEEESESESLREPGSSKQPPLKRTIEPEDELEDDEEESESNDEEEEEEVEEMMVDIDRASGISPIQSTQSSPEPSNAAIKSGALPPLEKPTSRKRKRNASPKGSVRDEHGRFRKRQDTAE
jgi:hypothetical protein